MVADVEADSEEEARQKFNDGDYEEDNEIEEINDDIVSIKRCDADAEESSDGTEKHDLGEPVDANYHDDEESSDDEGYF